MLFCNTFVSPTNRFPSAVNYNKIRVGFWYHPARTRTPDTTISRRVALACDSDFIALMDIILIDDEPDTHEFLGWYLESEGFTVRSAYNGMDGLALMNRHSPDLVILDVFMPQLGGYEICERIRQFSDVPIVMISAVARHENDIIHGLNIGADDFMPKPVRLDLLRARINALLRRRAYQPHNRRQMYVDAHLTIDLDREEVYVCGERVQLSPLEFRLLALLVGNAGYAVPTVEVIEELWSETDYEDYARYVRIYIGRLRESIEPDPRNPRYLITEHGFGYRFVPTP